MYNNNLNAKRNSKYNIDKFIDMKQYNIIARQTDKLNVFTTNPKATIKIIENNQQYSGIKSNHINNPSDYKRSKCPN